MRRRTSQAVRALKLTLELRRGILVTATSSPEDVEGSQRGDDAVCRSGGRRRGVEKERDRTRHGQMPVRRCTLATGGQLGNNLRYLTQEIEDET